MSKIDFQPYINFETYLSQINDFSELTNLSYIITMQQLFAHPSNSLPELVIPKADKKMSYCPADREIDKIKLTCEWISLPEYAMRQQVPLDEIEKKVEGGQLGPTVQNENNITMVIWPPEYQKKKLEQLPHCGKKSFQVSFRIKGQVSDEIEVSDKNVKIEETQTRFLQLAHALGDVESIAKRASEMLNRVVFLLEWGAFEVFLRDTFNELIRLHPHKLASGKRAHETLTLEELMTFSNNLTNIEQLCKNLTTREMEKQEQGGQSIHGILNFIKAHFHLDNDPYTVWYVVEGKQHYTSYQFLVQLKEVRNALVHDAGKVMDTFVKVYPSIPIRDGMIVIDDKFRLHAHLGLRSIAFRIASTISSGNYDANS